MAAQGQPEQVKVHDFIDPQLGKANPYGVYDVATNTGWVSVGTDHDTAAFAVNTIATWWRNVRKDLHPNASRLLISADGGGSNGYRTRLWKTELAALAADTGLTITVCHLPPGTSKWNKIEHRLFSHISMNWRGRPLTSHEVIVETIAATTTSTGLTVHAELDQATYPTGVKIPDKQMKALETERHPDPPRLPRRMELHPPSQTDDTPKRPRLIYHKPLGRPGGDVRWRSSQNLLGKFRRPIVWASRTRAALFENRREDDDAQLVNAEQRPVGCGEPAGASRHLADSRSAACRIDDLRREGPRYQVSADHHAAPAGRCPERADRLARRRRFRRVVGVRRSVQHTRGRAAGDRRGEAQPVPHHGAVLPDAAGPADGPQPPFGRAWAAVTESATSAPGNSSVRPKNKAPIAETLKLNGYSTAQFGKCHEVPVWEVSPVGPFQQWPTGSGFEYFYGFVGGEANQYYPGLYEGTMAIEPPRTPEEGYTLTEDLADRAVTWVRQQKALTPDKPFFMYFAPGATHAPHHVPKEWSDKYKGKFDDGLGCVARARSLRGRRNSASFPRTPS